MKPAATTEAGRRGPEPPVLEGLLLWMRTPDRLDFREPADQRVKPAVTTQAGCRDPEPPALEGLPRRTLDA